MARITYLSAIDFGTGEISSLSSALDELGIKRPLLIADKGIKVAGILDTVSKFLPGSTPQFLETPPNPTEDAVVAALAIFREKDCDGIVAVGGGSPIDLAKGVALLATHEGPLENYAVIYGGLDRITPVVPLIAVPTTAGTGAEVGRAALLTLSDGRKLGFISPHLIPKFAICDPELTLGLPAGLTAATGLDALSHCIETYLSPRFNPPADAIALDGAARIWKYLPVAFENGADITARTEVMMGALQGGLAFQKGLGAVHSLSHALGGLKDVSLHHGTLNAILMPHIMRENAPVVADKLAPLAAALGLREGDDIAQALSDMNRRLKLPETLADIGVTESHFYWVIERAGKDHSHATNPKDLTPADYERILHAALRPFLKDAVQ